MDVLLSMIIPVYNGELFIKKTVLNACSLLIKELQIILVDDGSTDMSGDICKKLASEDSRIAYLHKENGGIASARNLGLKSAIGKYICFMDQDDFIDNASLERLIDYLQTTEFDFCSCNNYRYYIDGHIGYNFPIKQTKIYINDDIRDICKNLISNGGNVLKDPKNKELRIVGTVWCCVFQREFIEKHHLRFEKYVDFEDDWTFLIKCLLKSEKLLLYEEAYYYWVIGHVSESRRLKYIQGFYDKRKELEQFLKAALKEIAEDENDYKKCIIEFEQLSVIKTIENEVNKRGENVYKRIKKKVREINKDLENKLICHEIERIGKYYRRVVCKFVVNNSILLLLLYGYLKINYINLKSKNMKNEHKYDL